MMMLTMMFVILMMVLKIFMMLVMLMMVLIISMMLVMLMPMMILMLMIEMETSDSDVITAPHGREQLFPSNSARHLLLRLFVQHQNVQG